MAELKNIHFDYVIIAIGNRKTSLEIKQNLMLNNIKEEKIIEHIYYGRQWFLKEKIEIQKELLQSINKVEGLIFGISYSLDGIDETMLGNYLKLSMGSQDIYYNYITFQRLISENIEIMDSIKNIIFDCYTYRYLHYDLSLSEKMFEYYLNGGIANDEHNFSKNPLCDNSLENTLKSKKANQRKCELLFGKIAEYKNEIEGKFYMDSLEEINVSKEIEAHCEKEWNYNETVVENKQYLEEMIRQIQSMNKSTNIYFISMPRYHNKNIVIGIFILTTYVANYIVFFIISIIFL